MLNYFSPVDSLCGGKVIMLIGTIYFAAERKVVTDSFATRYRLRSSFSVSSLSFGCQKYGTTLIIIDDELSCAKEDSIFEDPCAQMRN